MKLFNILLLLLIIANVYSQVSEIPDEFKRTALTVGILQGGGSLVGADLEYMVSERPGIQVGLGFTGFGAGINYHLKPSIRSSFISLQYWHQGIGDTFAQDVIGPNLVYRARKYFTCQIGLGVPLSRGPALKPEFVQPPVMLMYAIGAYFPF